MPNAYTRLHTDRGTRFFLRFVHVCVCVPFIIQKLRSAGSYFTYQDWSHRLHSCSALVRGGCSISPESLQGKKKKAAFLQSIQRSHKMLQLQMFPMLSKCFTAFWLSVGSNQNRFHLWSLTELMYCSYKGTVYLKGKTCHEAFKCN